MEPADFTDEKWGELIHDPNGYWFFVPNRLPPNLELTWDLVERISQADRGISELAGVSRNLPNPHLLIGPFLRREAVLSSRIEGTQASLSDLFMFEAAKTAPVHAPDVHEVRNYVQALEYGLQRLSSLPLSLRLLREMHENLMEGVRGEHLTPGEFRRSQNWTGPPGCTLMDATFVPPRVPEMNSALDSFERYLHEQSALPALVRIALVHYQFETIHPFLDGNGRVGRLLISLMLCHAQLLPQPLLYLSAFFEKNRDRYYELLLSVSQKGQWSQWVRFFLEGVAEQAQDAIWRTDSLLKMWQQYRQRLASARASALLLQLVDHLFASPVITIPAAASLLNVTQRSAGLNIQKLVDANILEEMTGRQRNRVFAAKAVIDAVGAARPE